MARIAVIGAGVSGLAVGFELRERGLAPEDMLVLEAADRPGGNIRTDREEGFAFEWGPNGFLDNSPPTLGLVTRLGIEDRLLPSRESSAIRFIFRAGRLHEVPTGPPGIFGTKLLSIGGKLRIFQEPFVPRGGHPSESVYDFAARRIGDEAARVMVDAMVSGVYAGDAKRLELRAAFPRMAELEARYGGLVKALFAIRKEKKREGAKSSGPAGPGGRLTSFTGGMEDLIEALAAKLGGSLRTGAPVRALSREGREWKIEIEGREAVRAETVVLSCPAVAAGRLVGGVDRELASLLEAIPSASIAVVATAYRKEDLERAPHGFGFLVPRGEGPRILGCLWTSSIWGERRAPETHVLLRSMVGGAHDPVAVDLPDEELLAIVARDLQAAMGLRAKPDIHRIFRYRRGIPQYEPGHTARLDEIRARLAAQPGLHIAGNSYGGISMNHCIAEAPGVAEAALGQ
ncbi:MAG: protoporphyrinogen oxidase [Candidatus Eisenbacteria bacterium]